MTLDQVALYLHVLGAVTLIGTGSGIAFFMLMAHRTRDARFIAMTARTVVIADWLFTASAVVIQPVTGAYLMLTRGWPLSAPWLAWSIGLYIFIGAFWLPVIALQYRLKRLAEEAAAGDGVLSADYRKTFRLWFSCGIPAFGAILVLLWMMLHKPYF